MPFQCSICGEESTRICARCTKDACDNHLCEKCLKCSDCCECEVTLSPHLPETVRAALQAVVAPEPQPEAGAESVPQPEAAAEPVAQPEAAAEPVAQPEAAAEPVAQPNSALIDPEPIDPAQVP